MATRSGRTRLALCLVDTRDPLFLSLYAAFEVHFARTVAEARSLLFSHSYDILIIDFDFRGDDCVLFTKVAQRVCSWIPILAFHGSEGRAFLEQVEHDGLSPCDKKTISQRTDDIALSVILEEERRFKQSCDLVSPLFVDQYDDLVRQTNALYHQTDLLLSLDEFAERILDTFPAVVSGVLYVRRGTAVICSNFPLPAGVLADLRDEAITIYRDFAETLLGRVREYEFKEVGFSLRLTVSIGLAISNTLNERDEQHLLTLADRALMLAKQGGRNQACSASEIQSRKVITPLSEPQYDPAEPEPKARILIVDDEPRIVNYLVRQCESWGYEVAAATNAKGAIYVFQASQGSIDVVLADISMPEMNGIEMARVLSTIDPDVVTVAITGHGTAENAIEALRAGIYNFVVKPVDSDTLEMVVKRAVEHRHLLKHRRTHELYTEDMLKEKTKALQANVDALKQSYVKTLETIVSIMDVKGGARTEHSRRVSEFGVFLAWKMGVQDHRALMAIRYGALLHDIGKIGVPEVVAKNGEALSPEDADRFREHIELSHRIVQTIPMLGDAAELVHSYHERFDGSGLPRGLKDGQIPLGAKVLALADAFDQWRFDTGKKNGLPLRLVVQRINENSGTRFDPEVVRTFNNCYQEMNDLFMDSEAFWENMEFSHEK